MHTLKQAPPPKAKTKPRDPFTRELAQRLKQARMATKPRMSQEEVGKLFQPNISRAAVSQWEDARKGTAPDLLKLVALSRAYKVTVDWLLTGEPAVAGSVARQKTADYSTGLSLEATEVAKLWASLPSVKRRLYKDAIEWDAAILEAFPAMKEALVVLNPNYHNMTERFSKDELVRQIQLNLPLSP